MGRDEPTSDGRLEREIIVGGSSEPEGGLITQINVTPLVDVVLVLLIIFMITAPLIQKRVMNVNVPKASTTERATAALQILYAGDGQIRIGSTPYTLDTLAVALKIRQKVEPDLKVSIAAEGALPYERVVCLLDAVRAAGVTKVALEVKPVSKKNTH